MTTATLRLVTLTASRKSSFCRRVQMIQIARKISDKIEQACRTFHAEAAAMEYDSLYHKFLGWQLHRQMSRYDAIVAALAAETGLEPYSVRNTLASDPWARRLLDA